MNFRFIFAATALLVIGACSKLNEQPADAGDSTFTVGATAEVDAVSRTTLDGNSLAWSAGDRMGVFIDGLQFNASFKLQDGTTNEFAGTFAHRNTAVAGAKCYAYYPYTYCGRLSATTVSAVLPDMQTAPFDASADFVVSDVVTVDYDEDDMPNLGFTFRNHLFSIVRITVRNSDEALASEKLMGVELQAKGCETLAGAFSFDVAEENCEPIFTTEVASLHSKVQVNYSTDTAPTLGKDTDHVIYAVVRAGEVSALRLLVKTTNYVSAIESAAAVMLPKGEIAVLPAVDVAALEHTNRVRTVVFWGDSITNDLVTSYLQQILGTDWKVVRGGIPGDSPLGIAGRQGGIQLCTGDETITIPGDCTQRVQIKQLYSQYNGSLSPRLSSYWFSSSSCPLLNPCTIAGVECNITSDDGTTFFVQRTENGVSATIEPRTAVLSYGAKTYKDADVVVTYLGANSSGTPALEQIVDCYRAIENYSSKKHCIEVGFHMAHIDFPNNGGSRDYWTETYRDRMTAEFGDNFLDMRTVGNANAARLLVESGALPAGASIPEKDRTAIADGDWPASLSSDYKTNVHPNTYGSRVIAILVKERMAKLGYLDF